MKLVIFNKDFYFESLLSRCQNFNVLRVNIVPLVTGWISLIVSSHASFILACLKVFTGSV